VPITVVWIIVATVLFYGGFIERGA